MRCKLFGAICAGRDEAATWRRRSGDGAATGGAARRSRDWGQSDGRRQDDDGAATGGAARKSRG
eukprot:2695450-Pyramimonas_sp.AAC.1